MHLHNSMVVQNKMLALLRTALGECCKIYAKLPSAEMSVIGGDGARHFRRLGVANVVTICPRLYDGTLAAYVCPDDVQLVVSDATHGLLRVQVQSDPSMSGDGNITLRYMLDGDCDQLVTKLRVCVRVCGVLLADMCVTTATFDGRTSGHRCDQHTLAHMDCASNMAINPVGTHLVTSDSHQRALKVYGLPDMNFISVINLALSGYGPVAPHGLCFTDTGALLVADYVGDRVLNLTLQGLVAATYAVSSSPFSIASRGDVVVVGSCSGVCVLSLETGVTRTWAAGRINAIAFVDADTLAVSFSVCFREMAGLYTLDGRLLRKIVDTDIISAGLATCADGCLLVTDYYRKRIWVFAPDGMNLTTSPLAAHVFQEHPRSIAVCGERVYVLEYANPVRISVFV